MHSFCLGANYSAQASGFGGRFLHTDHIRRLFALIARMIGRCAQSKDAHAAPSFAAKLSGNNGGSVALLSDESDMQCETKAHIFASEIVALIDFNHVINAIK